SQRPGGRATAVRRRSCSSWFPVVAWSVCHRTAALPGGGLYAAVPAHGPVRVPQRRKPPGGGFPRCGPDPAVSALARLETRVRLADHEDLAATADDLAVAVTGLRRLQGGQDLHDRPQCR